MTNKAKDKGLADKMMKESSGNGSTNTTNENNISSGGSSPHSASDCATLPAGSSSNTALVHRHINSNSNHASVKGGAFQTSLDDIDDVIVESPVGDDGGNFLTVNNFAGSSVINCSEGDHLFVGGSSSGGGQNGAVSGGESSRTSSSSGGGGGQNNNVSKSTVRLVLGVIVLVIVDVIWVASSELSFVSAEEIF